MNYLDNAATTYPKPEVVYQMMDHVNRTLSVNAGRGAYTLSKKATEIIDDTRAGLLKLVKAKKNVEVCIAPSATIASNSIIGGIQWKQEDVCYVSPYEHNAVMRPLHIMQQNFGFKIVELPLDENMEIDINKMKYMFSIEKPDYIFVTHISNVTGYILPIEEISVQAKKYDAKIVVDASQSLGLIDIDMSKNLFDFVIFAGHKNLYGPFGVGGFFIKKDSQLCPYISGGTGSDSLNLNMPVNMPGMFEPASPNIVAIAGLKASMEELGSQSDIETNYLEHEQKLIDYAVEKLKNKDIIMYLPPQKLGTGILAFNIKGYKASDVGMILDEDFDIAVRTGYHCAPLIHKYLDDKEFYGVVRASVGRFTTLDDIDRFVEAVVELSESV